VPKTKRIAPRRRVFADQYLVDLNASAAYKRAGYKAKNDRVAEVEASRLLRDPEVARLIAEGMKARERRTHITQDQVLQELAALAMSDLRYFAIVEDGNVKLADGAPDIAMRAASSIKKRVRYDEEGNRTVETEIKLWDKPGSLRTVAQHLGMLVEKVDVTTKGKALEPAKVTILPVAGVEVEF